MPGLLLEKVANLFKVKGEANMQQTTKLKGLTDIPTMKIVQRGLMRNPDQVFNELTQLNREKVRLYQERIFWQEKIDRIEARLNQIVNIMKLLQQQMEGHEESFKQQMERGTASKESPSTVQVAKPAVDEEEIRKEMVIRY